MFSVLAVVTSDEISHLISAVYCSCGLVRSDNSLSFVQTNHTTLW